MADERVGTSWSFSRCFKCGSFALVRQGESNIIKVDRAPVGEKVLLPEGSEQPMLSKGASDNLNRFLRGGAVSHGDGAQAKPEIRPATRRSTGNTQWMVSPAVNADSEAANKAYTPKPKSFSGVTRPSFFAQGAGSPLAGADVSAITETSVAAIPAIEEIEEVVPAPELLATPVKTVASLFPSPLPDLPEFEVTKPRLLPIAIGVAGAIAVASGIYLFVQGQDLWKKAHAPTAHRAPEPRTIKTVSAPVAPITPQAIVDTVHQRAMAPERSIPETQQHATLIVRPKEKGTHLRQGPGMIFGIAGIADENARYVATDWDDRWFKVTPENPSQPGPRSAWIRADSVQVLNNQP